MHRSGALWVRQHPGRQPPIVALHGFTQTGAMYSELAELLGREVLAPDLPGHGRSARHPTSFETAVVAVAESLAALEEPAPLIGYSQGGRVALAVALERPEMVSRLVLVSTTPGIEDEVERAERRHRDEALAEELKSLGVPDFLDRWLQYPMFAGLERRGAAWRDADRAVRLENTADGLAAALAGMGQGAQPYLGERLAGLPVPVLLIAGELDHNYVARAGAMHRALPKSVLSTIPDTGHAVIGEQPRVVASLVEEFELE